MEDLMGTTEIARLLGVSRQRVDQLTAVPGFPEPIATIAAGRIWQREDIVRWNAARRTTSPNGVVVPISCSFCAKTSDQVAKLIAGPQVYICNECVLLCVEIMDEEGLADVTIPADA